MHTHAERNGGVAAAAKEVAEHAKRLARLEVQLALAEVKKKALALGIGIGMLVTAALFGFFLLAFALAAGAAALTIVLAPWAALLSMMGFCLFVAGGLATVGALLLRKTSPPVPEQAIEEARLTTEAIRAE